jgi:polyphosphate glucokinase
MKTSRAKAPPILCSDIGGTGIKAMLVDDAGRAVSERTRVKTPSPSTPDDVFRAIAEFKKSISVYSRISVGFPGVVVDGVAQSAANLGTKEWKGVDVRKRIEKLLGAATRVGNDADIQGLWLIEGRGVELVLTLGTGIGSGLYLDGVLVPNLELGHAPFEKGKTYEQRLGKRALDKTTKREWRKRLARAIDGLRVVFNWRLLHLGGGHAELVDEKSLPQDVRVGRNVAGLLGGARLWTDAS